MTPLADCQADRPAVSELLDARAVAALCGRWNGALVAKFGMQPTIATLTVMVAGRG